MTGIEWVEAMDAAKYPVMHRTVLHNKGLSRPNVRGTEGKKPGPGWDGIPSIQWEQLQICRQDSSLPDNTAVLALG